MAGEKLDRKQFIAALGRAGAGVCMCAAVGGMRAALGAELPAPKSAAAADTTRDIDRTKPGDRTVERAAKRMEFADGWVQRFFTAVDATLDEPTRRRLMEANGKSCYVAYAGPPRREPVTLEHFKDWIAQHGQERGYSVEGRVISFEYLSSAETHEASPERLCLCPMVEVQSVGKISPTYCHCSVGYVREMHERMLGRPVQVELVDSVLRGGKRCRFRMTVA
jgi:hypothetical protein